MKPSLAGERDWEAFYETIRVRVIASQRLSRDNGETFFAPIHLDVLDGLSGQHMQKLKKNSKPKAHMKTPNFWRDEIDKTKRRDPCKERSH